MLNEQILRRSIIQQTFSIARSSTYEWEQRELLPPAISIGGRYRGFLRSEVEAVLKARKEGRTDAEVQELVRSLVAARRSAA